MQQMISETLKENPEAGYNPPKVRRTKIVNEKGKKRVAHLAGIREQWYFHIIVEVMKPIIMKRLSNNSVGCIPGRGLHGGKKKLESLARKGFKYFFKCDVRHFYDSVRIDIVINELRKDIADERFLYLIEKIYRYQKKGILIGLYISPWLANYMLISADSALERTPGVHMIRYVDDIVAVSSNKKVLREASVKLMKALGKLRLKLKKNYQIARFDYIGKKRRTGRRIDFMGFYFYRDRTVIRKCILINATRTARKLHKAKSEGRRYYSRQVRSLVSLMGWFKFTDSYDCYLMHIKPYVNIGKLKKIISKLDKEASKNDRLETGNMCGDAA